MIRLLPYAPVGENQHHSGWPYVLSGLQRLQSADGILVDDFCDRSFNYDKRYVPHLEPWVGMFHHPHNAPRWLPQQGLPRSYFSTDEWLLSEPHLRMGITFSDHAAAWLQTQLECPVVVLRHPIGAPQGVWTVDAWRRAQPRRLVQLGYFLRNTRAIYHLSNSQGLVRSRVWPRIEWVRGHDRMLRRFFVRQRRRVEHKGVVELPRLKDDEYEAMLCGHVVFMEVLAAVANNVVLECLVRNTPLVVNRLPGVVEYLGETYPLYYEELDQVPSLLTVERFEEASHYMSCMDKTPCQLDTFVDAFAAAVQEHALK